MYMHWLVAFCHSEIGINMFYIQACKLDCLRPVIR